MVSCGSHITISDVSSGDIMVQFDFLTELVVKHAWRTLTDTAELTVPRAVIWRYSDQHRRFEDVCHRGNKAVLKFGYDDRQITRFEGYVTSNKPGMPMKIEMEDEMFVLKTQSVKPKGFKTGVSVSDILKYLGIANYELIGTITILGPFTITAKEDTVSRALLKLKQTINLPIFFRSGVLHIGDPYQVQNPTVVDLMFGYNIISHTLEFKHADDVRIKVIAISNKKDGKKLKVIMGDKDGETHTLNFGDIASADLLIAEAKKYIGKLKYTGFRGTVTLFGEPVIRHGDIANFMDPENEITGKYWVDAVEERTGMGGIRQVVTIGVIADSGQSVGQEEWVNNIEIIGQSTESSAPSNNTD